LAYQANAQGHKLRYLEAEAVFAHQAPASAFLQQRDLQAWAEAELPVLDDLFLARGVSDAAGDCCKP
jgi:hypothetical protein